MCSVDLHCYVTGLNMTENKVLRILTITKTHNTIQYSICVLCSSHNNYFKKILRNKLIKNMEFSTSVGY